MLLIRYPLIFMITLKLAGVAYAGDDLGGIDKERVFPTQRNAMAPHDSKGNDVADQTNSSNSADAQKSNKKDASLTINGNGGSTNRAPGGNATLRKRFTFD